MPSLHSSSVAYFSSVLHLRRLLDTRDRTGSAGFWVVRAPGGSKGGAAAF